MIATGSASAKSTGSGLINRDTPEATISNDTKSKRVELVKPANA